MSENQLLSLFHQSQTVCNDGCCLGFWIRLNKKSVPYIAGEKYQLIGQNISKLIKLGKLLQSRCRIFACTSLNGLK